VECGLLVKLIKRVEHLLTGRGKQRIFRSAPALRENLAQVMIQSVLLLTTYNEDEMMLRGLQVGARGYLLKESSQETLLHAIRAATRGEMVVQPEIMARILTYTNHTPAPSSLRRERTAMNLTEREQAVLEGLVRGERNKEIAARMGITMRTVEAHLTSIYTKLQVDSRSAAIVAAIERGLLPPIQTE